MRRLRRLAGGGVLSTQQDYRATGSLPAPDARRRPRKLGDASGLLIQRTHIGPQIEERELAFVAGGLPEAQHQPVRLFL
jgi:hypothetical protein